MQEPDPRHVVKAPRSVAVVGGGIMGSGIAALLANAGVATRLFDPDAQALERAVARAGKLAARLADGGEGRPVSLSVHLELAAAVADAELVIEAAPERLELKRELFAELDALCAPGCVLASNTSELSVTAIAAATKRPQAVVGMHWFNPPERMQLVELVRGTLSSDSALAAARALAEACGKTCVVVADRQGFVTTRAVAALMLEGVRMLEEGVAAREDIDTAVRLGLNHPMGPLELADYVGLDTVLLISESLHEALGESFRPPQTLRKLVESGQYGRKTGSGFYDYAERAESAE